MSDDRKNLVERFTGRPSPSTPAEPADNGDGAGYEAAALVSANRPPECMLELRLKRGDSLALSYPLLISATFNPSQGISLEFTSHRVAIGGRNLRPIFHALVAHRLAHLQELPGSLDDQPEKAAVITSIQVTAI